MVGTLLSIPGGICSTYIPKAEVLTVSNNHFACFSNMCQTCHMPINGTYSPYAIERARKAIEYIHNHFRETFSPEQLAEEVKMDTKQLQSLVQFLTGYTVHNYKMHVRIDHAKLELEHFSKGVKDIARNFGFGSASHFIREFKKRTGITPGQYRIQLVGQ